MAAPHAVPTELAAPHAVPTELAAPHAVPTELAGGLPCAPTIRIPRTGFVYRAAGGSVLFSLVLPSRTTFLGLGAGGVQSQERC